jgi:uncharacterized protein YnzC (UPF0291/DUF896 family)
MLLFVTILLSICLIASTVVNVLLYKAGVRQLSANEILEEDSVLLQQWVEEFKVDVLKTSAHMKLLDDKQMFEKDDDVGIVFRDMMELIHKLNERTQETVEE